MTTTNRWTLLALLVLIYVVLVATTSLAQPTDTPGIVNTGVLNVRAGPGTTYPVIGTVRDGQIVTVSATNAARDWLYICCVAGKPGWVSARYIVEPFDTYRVPVYQTGPFSPLAAPVSPLAAPAPRGAAPMPPRIFLPEVGR